MRETARQVKEGKLVGKAELGVGPAMLKDPGAALSREAGALGDERAREGEAGIGSACLARGRPADRQNIRSGEGESVGSLPY